MVIVAAKQAVQKPKMAQIVISVAGMPHIQRQ